MPLGYVDSWIGGGGVSADGPQGDEGGGDGDDEHQGAHEHLHQVYILLPPEVMSFKKGECNNEENGSADGREDRGDQCCNDQSLPSTVSPCNSEDSRSCEEEGRPDAGVD